MKLGALLALVGFIITISMAGAGIQNYYAGGTDTQKQVIEILMYVGIAVMLSGIGHWWITSLRKTAAKESENS